MKVVEIISDTNIGGAGVLLCTRLKYTDPKEFETCVLLPKGSQLKTRIESLGYPVYEVTGSADCSWTPKAFSSYIRILKRLRPDLVNCHASLTGRLAATLCGVPTVVYTRHCVYPLNPWQKTKIGQALLKLGQNLLLDHAIAVAHTARDNLIALGVSPKSIRVIINGVEGKRRYTEEERKAIRSRLGYGKDHFVLGICARLEACKGHEDLLGAASILLAKDPRFRFLIVGGGSRERELRKECKIRGLTPYVTFTDFVEDVTPYMNAMDLQINCSRGSETSSLSLSEGMSLGIPMVVSDYGGNPYMVREGENGSIYPVGDATALAKKIWEIYQDPPRYNHMSKCAVQRFLTELNAESMTKQTCRLYRALDQKNNQRAFSCPKKSSADARKA